jgi:hypothetical protein
MAMIIENTIHISRTGIVLSLPQPSHLFTNLLLHNLAITLLDCITLVSIFSLPIGSIGHYCDKKVMCAHLKIIVAESALWRSHYLTLKTGEAIFVSRLEPSN